jgi:hypothetical protein
MPARISQLAGLSIAEGRAEEAEELCSRILLYFLNPSSSFPIGIPFVLCLLCFLSLLLVGRGYAVA